MNWKKFRSPTRVSLTNPNFQSFCKIRLWSCFKLNVINVFNFLEFLVFINGNDMAKMIFQLGKMEF